MILFGSKKYDISMKIFHFGYNCILPRSFCRIIVQYDKTNTFSVRTKVFSKYWMHVNHLFCFVYASPLHLLCLSLNSMRINWLHLWVHNLQRHFIKNLSFLNRLCNYRNQHFFITYIVFVHIFLCCLFSIISFMYKCIP